MHWFIHFFNTNRLFDHHPSTWGKSESNSPLRSCYSKYTKGNNRSRSAKSSFISSTAVYGETEGTIVESTPTAAVSLSGKQLVECEQILQNATAYDTSIIRFGGLIGPDRHPIFALAKRTQIDNPEGK